MPAQVATRFQTGRFPGILKKKHLDVIAAIIERVRQRKVAGADTYYMLASGPVEERGLEAADKLAERAAV